MRLVSCARAACVVLTAGVLIAPTGAVADPPLRGEGPGGPCDAAPTINGTNGDDTLVGTPGADVIFGLGGDDTIRALAGEDTVCAGPGDDAIFAGSGRDAVSLGGGADEFRGGEGDDWVQVYGGAGDRAYGGPDEDTFVVQIAGDGAGLNTIRVDGNEPARSDRDPDRLKVVARDTRANLPVDADARRDTIRSRRAPGNGTVRGIDAFVFTSWRNQWAIWVDYAGAGTADDVTVTRGRLIAAGGSGNDRFSSVGGHDRIRGDGGNDTVATGAGDDTVLGGDGRDGIDGGPGNDALYGGPGADRLDGAGGIDLCVGGESTVRCEH
ncbi:calcium-binding protein [Nocardioides immobilis]|uniref:Calcium-binding protein n=1 Tax=Nocardioides immobilis TaxID=2049295 RepID=A0A417Y513_9ACTN|nr:calcium-binding protein [Nocardioides immobilis]RHW27677.1 calcium-binding protein [Nocardioides immobilis]